MYEKFASVYDIFIDADYKKTARFYKSVFEALGKDPRLVLDLGCGTGTLTNELVSLGYDAFGVDSSAEMLSLAKEKYPDILFINQDMRELDLYGTCGAAVSSLDCLNYITEESDMERVFALVANFLDPGGAFIFDVSSVYKLSEVNACNTFVMESPGVFGVWENEYREPYLSMELNFFIENGGVYTRFRENQTQRAWKRDELVRFAVNAHFEVRAVCDGFSFEKAHDLTEREVFVLVKE